MRLALLLLALFVAALAYLAFSTPPYAPKPVEQAVPNDKLAR